MNDNYILLREHQGNIMYYEETADGFNSFTLTKANAYKFTNSNDAVDFSYKHLGGLYLIVKI